MKQPSKRQQWQKLQREHPDIAELAANAAPVFVKLKWIKVTSPDGKEEILK